MNDLQAELDRVGADVFTARDYAPGRVIHVVLFRFVPEADLSDRAEVERRFRALATEPDPERGRYITSIDAGPNTSGEGAGGGFDLGFVVTFASEGDRNFYVGAPVVTDEVYFDAAHARFKEFVGPLLAGVLVYDIVA